MAVRLGINGFGRIGRNVLRRVMAGGGAAGGSPGPALEVVAVNDLTDAATLAHLLTYDSVHGKAPFEVRADGDTIHVGGRPVKVFAEKDPSKLPWSSAGCDVVLECTGIFTKREKAGLHLDAGAKKVLVSAPSPDPDATIAYGVNHDTYDPSSHHVVSCASCTTNCLAPVAKVILENFGVVRGTMTTIHSYTNDQNILDLPHKDLRRARAAAVSMIPTTTGAAKAVGLVIPALKGKVDGFAVRVPTPDVSVVDFVAEVEKDVTVEDVNRALRAAAEGPLRGILGFSAEPLVSCDYIGSTHSGVVDSLCTMVVQKRMVKVVAWYDNEMGFSSRMCDVASLLGAGR